VLNAVPDRSLPVALLVTLPTPGAEVVYVNAEPETGSLGTTPVM